MSIGQKQTVESLRFLLYDRALHPELFDIHHDHRIVKGGYEAQIWVTGCTHVIGFYRDEVSLVEVAADRDTELPQRGLLLDMPFRGERDHERRRADGINYLMSFQVEPMTPDVYVQTHHDLAKQGAKRGLFVPFPMWMTAGAPGLTPFTYIDYQAKPNQLHVFAFHAFPADLTVVKTQSIFELA